MFPKRIIKFLKLTKLRRKLQPKRDLLRLLLSLLIELVFFIGLALQNYFIQNKIGYIFSFHSSFVVLIFTFDMRVSMTHRFCVINNNGNNVRCATDGEISNKCYAMNHTRLLVRLRTTAQEYLFCSYQSLHSSRKFTQRRRNFR